MKNLTVVVALTTRDNDYQAEQAAVVADMAARLGAKIEVIYADNDAVHQTQQLIKIIQDAAQRPSAILVEPVGTGMPQVAKAAVAAGVGWGMINSDPDYIPELRRGANAPVFSVSTDQSEVGRIQGCQIAALVPQGNILYVEGPASSTAAQQRTKGMLTTKPAAVTLKTLRGDWTERSGQRAVESWLGLGSSRHYRMRWRDQDRPGMGAARAVAGHDRYRSGCGDRAGVAGEVGSRGIEAARANADSTALVSDDSGVGEEGTQGVERRFRRQSPARPRLKLAIQTAPSARLSAVLFPFHLRGHS